MVKNFWFFIPYECEFKKPETVLTIKFTPPRKKNRRKRILTNVSDNVIDIEVGFRIRYTA